MGSVPESERSPREHGNPLLYTFLENPMDRGAWQATVRRVAQSRTRLKQISTHPPGSKLSSYTQCYYKFENHAQKTNRMRCIHTHTHTHTQIMPGSLTLYEVLWSAVLYPLCLLFLWHCHFLIFSVFSLFFLRWFFKNYFILFYFIYFWMHWFFVAACGLFLVAASGGYSLVAVHRFLIAVASHVKELRL